jgi:hypothetical protein
VYYCTISDNLFFFCSLKVNYIIGVVKTCIYS